MTRESTLGDSAIREQFHELSTLLDEELTVFLIGGGALTLGDLKSATKDIDLVVRDETELERLRDALEAEGYSPPDHVSEEYDELNAAFILENGKRRFDVFHEQVAGVLVLSEAMADRSEQLFEDGPLTVRRVSLEDIFLFKAVANRDDDVDDMVRLAQAGVSNDIVLEEVETQLSILAEDGFIRSMKYKMERLSNEGYDLDIQGDVEQLHSKYSAANDVSQRIRDLSETEYADSVYEGVPRWRIEQELGERTVKSGVEWLERIGEVTRYEDGSLSISEE